MVAHCTLLHSIHVTVFRVASSELQFKMMGDLLNSIFRTTHVNKKVVIQPMGKKVPNENPWRKHD